MKIHRRDGDGQGSNRDVCTSMYYIEVANLACKVAARNWGGSTLKGQILGSQFSQIGLMATVIRHSE